MRRWASKWIGWVRVMAFWGVVFGLIVRIGDPLPISIMRNAAFDFYHQSKPREYTPMPVAIVDVDDNSLVELGQWPWPRSYIAEIVRKADAAGAVAIAFDIVFSEPDRLSPSQIASDNPDLPLDLKLELNKMPDNDDILAEAFSQAKVVVGQTSVRTSAGNRAEKQEMTDIPHALIGPDPSPFLLKFPDVVQNLPALEASASGHGMFTARPDSDGVYRRAPLVVKVQDKIRLGLSAELLRVATGSDPFVVRTNQAGVEGVVVARQLIQTDYDGTVWPYFTHSTRARFVSAADLLTGRVPPQRLAGHLVFVGTSAIGLEDFRASPLGIPMAGVEMHAQVLENILGQSLLKRPNYAIAVELVITFFLCVLVIVFAPVLAARWLIGSAFVLLSGYVAASYYLFHQNRELLDPSFPVFSTMLTFMLMATVNYLREERQRRTIRNAFGQYVSPALVDRLSRNPKELSLGGETRELTVLFSDVRGFTAIAEDYKDDPEALTQLMNRFLTLLSNAIMDNGGTIDKFMGDAVMAFWNAPMRDQDHVLATCRAALRIMEDVKVFNRRRAARARLQRMKAKRGKRTASGPAKKVHRLDIGVGINTGVCVVGNMGSDTRFDYTALGDPVNVASRLEGQSRYYGDQVILGSATAKVAQDDFAILELDTIRVVGKEQPETIFALIGDRTMRDTPGFHTIIETNRNMLAAYRAQDWDTADALLDSLEKQSEDMHRPRRTFIALYRKRIEKLRQDPPGPDWDTVFSSPEKYS